MPVDDQGRLVLTKRCDCERTNISGVVSGIDSSYSEVIGINLTFRESESRTASKKLLFVILKNMGSEMLIGCPALDEMGFASYKHVIELRSFDLDIHTAHDSELPDRALLVSEPLAIRPDEVRELWCPSPLTDGDWTIKASEDLPENLLVAEGPARFGIDGSVRIFVCTRGKDTVRFGAQQPLATLEVPTDKDLKEQQLIESWRRANLEGNLAALGEERLYAIQEEDRSLAGARRTPLGESATEASTPTGEILAGARRPPLTGGATEASTPTGERIFKVGNSYKKRNAKLERLAMFPKLLEEIKKQRASMAEKKVWDQATAEWKDHLRRTAKLQFGGTEEEWNAFATQILDAYADRFWDAGCPAPEIKNFVADISLKEGSRPSARRPFKLSEYDEARLDYRCDEFVNSGQMYQVDPQDAGEWSSPAFIVDKVGDMLGRLVTDYEGPNRETEDHPGVPADAETVLRKAAHKRYHTVMDMVWGFSQIQLSEKAQRILTIVTKSGLRRWKYLPMGPKQGPGICQGFNDFAFGDLEATSVFVDDFHTGSKTFEEHIADLKELLERGRQHGVQWRLSKCHFFQPKVRLIGFEMSEAGRLPDPEKVTALRNWPVEESLSDVVSLFHFANYLREFIPNFDVITAPFKKHRQKGAKWEAYLEDATAQEASRQLRHAVATQTPLVNPDFTAASNYMETGRPFLLFVDASDYGYAGVLAQQAEIHGVARPIAVLSKSFDETQQRWTAMERELHALYEVAMWSQKYAKSFKIFCFTDHKNNTFRSKIQPTRRVSKKLLKMCIELEPLGIERVYLAGDANILGDAPSRAPADRALARNLPVPLGAIRDTIHRMFWAPDEVAGDTKKRLQELGIENPGMLAYLPVDAESTAVAVNEALQEDEVSEPTRAFDNISTLQKTEARAEKLHMVRRRILENASKTLGDLGDELIPLPANVAGQKTGTWHVAMMPATELSVPELPDELIGADRVTRVTDARGDNWVAWFPHRLKGRLEGEVPGRDEPIRDGARSLWYKVSTYGAQRAEQLAKRHIRRPGTRAQVWSRLRDAEPDAPMVEEERDPVRKRLRGKTKVEAEGRPVHPHENDVEEIPDKSVGQNVFSPGEQQIALIDVFGGVSASRVACEAAGLEVWAHDYVEIHEPAVRVAATWWQCEKLCDIRQLANKDG